MGLLRIDKPIPYDMTIILGLIKSTEFCKAVVPILNTKIIKAEPLRVFASALLEYYAQYECAPGENVQGIYSDVCAKLRDVEVEMLSANLESIGKALDDPNYNVDYNVAAAIKYINTENMYILADEIKGYASSGRPEVALTKIKTFDVAKVYKPSFIMGTEARRYLKNDEDKYVLQLAGPLGQFLGPWKRKWLVAFAAPPKGGKSFFMLDCIVQGLMQRRKVVLFTHELDEEEYFTRILQNACMIAPIGDTFIKRPIFDCLLNRDNACHAPARCNHELYEYGNNPRYKECVACSCVKNSPYKRIITDVHIHVPPMTADELDKRYRWFEDKYGANLLVEKFPQGTANYDKMNDTLEYASVNAMFNADIIISDYAEAQGTETEQGVLLEDRGRVFLRWQRLKRLADERNALVITGSQGNRSAISDGIMAADKIGDDYRKLGIIDAGYGISCNDAEKDRGIVRVNIMNHRHQKYVPSRCCTVLQHLETSKTALDSAFGSVDL